MGSINDLLKRLQAVNIPREAEEALIDSSQELVNAQKDQLLRGIRKDGKLIGKYKNKAYAAKKAALNPLAGLGNVDLKLTGQLYKDVFVDVRSDVFVLDSADIKTGGLIKKYGDPFGLTPQSRETVIKEKLRKVYTDRVKDKLKL